MSWQSMARWLVAAVGLGCAVAIFVYARSRPAPPAPPVSLTRIDPKSELEAGAGQTTIYRADRSPVTISFKAVRRYDDGRARFEDVRIEGLEGSRFTVRASVMDASGPADRPTRLQLTGSVVLTTDDGLELHSDTATWDDPASRLTMPGPVTFTKGRLSGRGTGAAYDRAADAFTLLDRASARVEPDAGGRSAVEALSQRMTLARGQRTLQMHDGARVVIEDRTLTANAATLSFTDQDRVEHLELRGAAKATPSPGGPAGRPAMNADTISMAFQEDGLTLRHATLTGQAVLDLSGDAPRAIRASWIDFFTAADGRTLTRLHAKDRVVVALEATAASPGRTITASALAATGDETRGLTSARFDGAPRFEEAPAGGAAAPGGAGRAGTAVTLVLTLGGRIDAIERADFQQQARFEDGDVTGWADVAQYEEARGLLRLIANAREPSRRSRVTTADMTVDAAAIDLDTNTDDLRAQGDVTSLTTPAPGGADGRRGALFGGDEPIFGSGERLQFMQGSGTAIYAGSPRAQARLRQGESEVVADRIEFTDRTRNLSAAGRVDSTWLLDVPGAAAGGPSVKKHRVRAETLQYDEAARTAVYRGPVVAMTTADSEIEASTLAFRLAAASRTLESMRAERAVWARLSGGYEAVGDVLVYQAGTEVYTLEGKAGHETAQVKSPRADGASAGAPLCSLNEGMTLELDRRTGLVRVPGGGQAPRNVREVGCGVSLRRGK